MKKNILYIGIAVLVGLLGGWLIFGGSANDNEAAMTETHDHSDISTEQLWTCSMHPQIMQPEPGDCPICGMDLIPAESSAVGLAMNEIKMTKNAMALANIQTTIIGKGTIEANAIKLSGKIVVNEDKTATQPAHFNGRIEKLYVNSLGQRVKMGEPIAQIYSPELIAAQQELITAYRLRKSQPKLYKAVRNKFKNWKIHGSQLSEIETTGEIKTQFTIYSHVSGVVSEIIVDEGAHIMDGHPIFKVTNLATVWAEFDAYEHQISEFKKGQKIKVTTNAYPNKEFDATVSFIDPVLNTQTRTVTVRANLNNKDGLFKPGMFVAGKVEGKTNGSEMQLRIPASAVMWTGERSLVYIKTNPNEPVFEMRQVTLGNRNDKNYSVMDGLENGDEIVTNGTFTVDAAAQLQGKKSMMNQTEKDNQTQMMNMEMELSEKFQKAFSKSLPSYLKMKDAFVDSDASQVSAFAKATSKSLKEIKNTDLRKMTQSHLTKTIEMLDAIAAKKDLENQRAHFVILNENMVAIAMNLENVTDKLYVQKCPMANNDKGAMWMSLDVRIENPYYGEQMLTCGSNVNEIK